MLLLSEREQKKEEIYNLHNGSGKIELTYLVNMDQLIAETRLIAKVDFEVDSWIGSHSHESEEEIFYIIQGKGMLEIDGEQRELNVGDTVIIKVGQTHSLKNIGYEVLSLVSIILSIKKVKSEMGDAIKCQV